MTSKRRHSDSTPAIRPTAQSAIHVAAHSAGPTVVRVVKLGGRAQGDPTLPTRLHDAVAVTGARLVVVHGGGDEVSALQRQMGTEPTFVGGRRVTSPSDLDTVRMVLSGAVNKRLVAQFITAGVRAVGLSGEDGGLITARVTNPAFGRVGGDVITDATLVADLLNSGWVPVISPLARDREAANGAGLNVNGDDAAASIAAALGADELVFVADVPGVFEDGTVLRGIDTAAIAALVARGVVQGGMRAKLEAATMALRNGVRRVRVAGLAGITDHSAGTVISLTTTNSREHA